MKILILTASVGEGHNSVARAISEQCHVQNLQTKTIDALGGKKCWNKLNQSMLLFANRCCRKMYDKIWSNHVKNIACSSKIQSLLVKKNIDHVDKVICDFQPDAIICTHNYGSRILSELKKQNKLSQQILTTVILTDFVLYTDWQYSTGVDFVVLSHEGIKCELLKRGFVERQLKVLGIPTRPEFKDTPSKAVARASLELPDRFTVLVTSGGVGFSSNIPRILAQLSKIEDINIIHICGKNAVLKKQIDSLIQNEKVRNVYNFGFVTNMSVMMSASDCMISRGGGLSLSEALNKHLPIIIREKMITQEKGNCALLTQCGVALCMTTVNDACRNVLSLIDNPSIIDDMTRSMQNLRKPNALENILALVTRKK